MDWGFLNIFKNANFNILMLSVAVTGWIILLLLYALGVFVSISWALFCFLAAIMFSSVYCILLYIKTDGRTKYKNWKKHRKYKMQRKIEISRMFNGLQENNRNQLAYWVLAGKEDEYQDHVMHFDFDINLYHQAFRTRDISKIYRESDGSGGVACIGVNRAGDSFYMDIDPILLKLINKDIKKRKLVLNSNGDK